MLSLADWASRWGIPDAAIRELAGVPSLELIAPPGGTSEAHVQVAVRLEAARAGWHVWRNNRGAFKDETGRLIRYGLANDSKQLGDKLKSADLVGWKTHMVTSDDVGKKFAVPVSRECKPVGWRFNPKDPREVAQMRWHLMVLAAGGDSAFVTGTGSIK